MNETSGTPLGRMMMAQTGIPLYQRDHPYLAHSTVSVVFGVRYRLPVSVDCRLKAQGSFHSNQWVAILDNLGCIALTPYHLM